MVLAQAHVQRVLQDIIQHRVRLLATLVLPATTGTHRRVSRAWRECIRVIVAQVHVQRVLREHIPAQGGLHRHLLA